MKYTLNPAWRLIKEGSSLIVTAGADKQYIIEEITPENIEKALAITAKKSFAKQDFPSDMQETFEQLLLAEVCIPTIQKTKPIAVSLLFIGDPIKELGSLVKKSLPEHWKFTDQNQADFLVIVRSNASLAELADGVQFVRMPHVFIDLAYEHTISVGPLVILGDTACIGCLAGRISLHWGDPLPPTKPLVQKNIQLITGIINQSLNSARLHPEKLMNKSISYNFENPEAKQQSLLRYPSCKICGDTEESNGQVLLPWLS